MKHDEKYVVLEHLTLPGKGLRFWCVNTENNTHGPNGELWYKEILFTDDIDKAIQCSRELGDLATFDEIHNFQK